MKELRDMTNDELRKFITEKKENLGSKVCILEHNFQLEDILEFADIIGDTTSLLNKTKETTADYLVYCGARFFTEAGSILCPDKKIIQASMKADCPLTYEADESAISNYYQILQEKSTKNVVPVIYFTASYNLKAFAGEHDGTTCTASGAKKIIEHYLDRGESVFFTPMSNIAYNVVNQIGLDESDVVVLNELSDISQVEGDKKVYIWDIGCYVHSGFKVEDVEKIRKEHEGIKIISHLECLPDVIAASDYSSFTDGIWDIVKNNPEQESWGLATVNNFAYRLAKNYPEKTIVAVRDDLCCEGMVVTELVHLAECLQSIEDYEAGTGPLKTELKVPARERELSMKAINKMYSIVNKEPVLQEA
ncbi:MAG: quinolinate synthase NadA [Spirochaetales bacterium]|nr:quinolinate synthase NadA [Spirochaetales bacterium]